MNGIKRGFLFFAHRSTSTTHVATSHMLSFHVSYHTHLNRSLFEVRGRKIIRDKMLPRELFKKENHRHGTRKESWEDNAFVLFAGACEARSQCCAPGKMADDRRDRACCLRRLFAGPGHATVLRGRQGGTRAVISLLELPSLRATQQRTSLNRRAQCGVILKAHWCLIRCSSFEEKKYTVVAKGGTFFPEENELYSVSPLS